jgi:hypothetical protein
VNDRIFCAAIKLADGRVFCSSPPMRHSDIISDIHAAGDSLRGSIQGFLTSTGVFLNRGFAYQVALAAGQLLPQDRQGHTPTPGTLYTEDLW